MGLKTKKCYYCNKKVSYNADTDPKLCPLCGGQYWNKPEIEIRLHILQDKWFKNNDRKDFDELFTILHGLTYNIICGKLKSSGKFLDNDDIYDKVHFAMVKMLEYYNKPGFSIDRSFTEYMNDVVLYPLYNKKDRERDQTEISFYTPLREQNGGKERLLLDKLAEEEHVQYTEDFYINNMKKDHLIENLIGIIDTMYYQTVQSYGMIYGLNMLTLIYHKLNGANAQFFNNWWNKHKATKDFQNQFEEFMLELKRFLQHEESIN